MADNRDFIVSYVRITEEGLEREKNIPLSAISQEDRMDIKSITFLPVESEDVIDVTGVLTGFPILESIYLPSMMFTTIEKVAKECPMIKSILLISRSTINNSLDQSVVKVNAEEEDGDNTAKFMTFVSNTKDGKQTFVVNPKQVLNQELVIQEKVVERLTPSNVKDYISGENGILAIIEAINAEIEDERCRIEISQEMLEGLLGIFVEKGVTFEEFTIDFSKLYDKIESYKAIAKTVNQVSIKEDVEANIIEAYQNVLQRHYENVMIDFSQILEKLISGVSVETEEALITDLVSYIASVVVDSPAFDEDYKEGDTLDTILSEMTTVVSRNIRKAKIRGLARKYLSQVIAALKEDKTALINLIENKLSEKVSLEDTREIFANKFGLDLNKSKQADLVDKIVEIIVKKNLGILTKDDINGIIDRVEKEMGNGEVRSKEMLEIITRVVEDYPTKEEIKQVLVDFIAKNGYSAIKVTNA